MNRRNLLRLLPLSAFGLASPSEAKIAPPPPAAAPEPSPWIEMVCQREACWENAWGNNADPATRGKLVYPACGTRFKMIRGATPVCPVCYATQNVWTDELRKKFVGFVVG